MKFRRNYDPNSTGGNGAAAVEAPAADTDFSAWAIPEGGIEGVETGDSIDAPEEAPAGEEGADGTEQKEGNPAVDAPTTEPKEGEESAEDADGADDDTLPALKDDENIDEPETTWEEVGKRFELPEVDDATLQGEEKFAAQIQKLKTAEYERGLQDKEAIDLKKYSPAEQNFIQALNAGMKLEDVVKPAHGFYSAAAGTDEEIMTLYFTTALSQDAALAEDSVAVLEANGTLKIEAQKVRAQLLAKAEEVVNQNVKTYSEKYAQERDRIAKETERENSVLKAEIMSRESFMDGKLTKEAKEKIAKRWESGYYKNRMQNDPKVVAEFILFTEYGEAQYKKAKETAAKSAKKETFEKLSNTPKTPSGSQNSGQPVKDGDFSSWGTVKPTGVEHG